MLPVLLRVGTFRLPSYWVLFACGALSACLFWSRRRVAMGLRVDRQFWALINTIILSLFFGGRLLNMLVWVPFSAADYWEQAFSLGSGFSILGSLLGLVAGVWWFCRAEGLSFARLFDGICLMGPVWHFFGRLGCFLNGCCYGRPTDAPWGVTFVSPESQVGAEWLGRRLHPTQLYEAGGDVALLALLFLVVEPRVASGRLRPGSVAAAYLFGYGAIRFFVEFFRGDTVAFLPRLTAGQAVALGLCALPAGWALVPRRGAA